MKKILLLISGLALTVGLAQISGASVEDEIAARIAKEGSVCVEGEDCAKASAGATMVAAAGGSGFDVEKTYSTTCATCHAMGIANAPKLGDKAAWAPRIEKGMETLYTHAIDGLPPAMPAKGMCFQCSDEELKAIVDYMVDAAK